MSDLNELEDIGELEAENQKIEAEQPKNEEVEVPERYKGRTIADIVKMHQEAEKALSRQGQELGEVRKLADQLIQKELAEKTAKKEVKPQEVDFFENPQEAIRQAVESNPEVQAAKQFAVQAKQEQARLKLLSKHPDAVALATDAAFGEWVQSSPVRTKLFVEANQNYDFDAADELLSTYKQLQAKKAEIVEADDKESRTKALKSAAVDVGGSGESSKKVYRKADIIRLRMTDPARYDALSAEIQRAYAEGRVR